MAKLNAFATVCLLLLSAAPPAQAEPFVVGAGSGLELQFLGDSFHFVGSGFSIHMPGAEGVGGFGLFFTPRAQVCEPCTTGDVFDPSFDATGALGSGSASFGSTSFSNVTFNGALNFDATPLAFPASTASGLTLETPFRFTGLVRGTQGTTEVFSASLTGSGRVLQGFDQFPNGTYTTGENPMAFLFDAAPAATPEPGTLLLLGTGAVALVGRARRKFKLGIRD